MDEYKIINEMHCVSFNQELRIQSQILLHSFDFFCVLKMSYIIDGNIIIYVNVLKVVIYQFIIITVENVNLLKSLKRRLSKLIYIILLH